MNGKKYIYKWFDSNNVFVGVLKVNNTFSMQQEINTAGSQIELEIPVSLADANLSTDFDELVDENGDNVVDEQNNLIITDIEYTTGNIPNINDRIEVWEYSDYHPNGIKMFNGLVYTWQGSYLENSVTLTVVSYGIQLDNYLIQVLPQEIITENPVGNIDDSVALFTPWKFALNRNIAAGQTFQVPIDTEITGVRITIGNGGSQNVPVLLSIKEGTPLSPGPEVAFLYRNIPPQGNIMTDFLFSAAVSLQSSKTYHFFIYNNDFGSSDTNVLTLGFETTGTYADGQMYLLNDSTGWSSNSSDIGFEITSSSGGIGNQFLSQDPSSIFRELVDTFNSLGGVSTYTNSSVATTNSVVSYTFKFNTYLEGLKKCVELAPADWYWYGNPADDTLYFDRKRSTVSHTLVRGKHIHDIEPKFSLDSIKNLVVFSGGQDNDGVNIISQASNTTSLSRYGQWLDLPTDNRVTLTSTADIISGGIINQKSNPRFSVKVKVPASTYDITSFKIGQTVAFANFNELINSLSLQIYAIDYKPDLATLILEILPPTQSKRIEDIRRNLNNQQTENNPDD